MSKIIDSVRLVHKVIVAATGTGLIATDRVKQGQSLVIQSVAFRNRTGVRGAATLQIRQSGVSYPLAYEPAPAAGEWYTYTDEQHISEGEQVEVSQASCTEADVLDLVVIGYLEFKSELQAVKSA